MDETRQRVQALERSRRTMRFLVTLVMIGAIAALGGVLKVRRQVAALRDHITTKGITVVDADGRTMVAIGRFPATIQGGSVVVYGRPVQDDGESRPLDFSSWTGSATLGVHDAGGFVSTSKGPGRELVRLSETTGGAGLIELFRDGQESNRLGPSE